MVVALAACGGTGGVGRACGGLPTAKRTTEPLVLFGHLHGLTREFFCANFGRPNSVKSLSGGRETWTYGNTQITLRQGRVIDIHSGRVPIGG